MNTKKKYVVSDPAILDGTPVITGTRIPVWRIIHMLRDGYTMDAILEDYPQISAPALRSVVNQVIKKLESPQNASWLL